jgi:hypothetical protein
MLDCPSALLGTLDRLAGAPADHFTPSQLKLFASLAPAELEDGIFIYYAGHGHAVGQRFYLLTHDFVIPQRSEDFALPESHAISDLELDDVFERIGAGRTLFVIDACRSGQALESEEKRQRPNSLCVVIICAIAEMERNLMVERVRTGMRRARLDTTHIGRNPFILVHEAIHRKRCQERSSGKSPEATASKRSRYRVCSGSTRPQSPLWWSRKRPEPGLFGL